MSDGPVIASDISILLRLARLNVAQGDASFLGPLHQLAADVFRPLSTRIAIGLPRHSMIWFRLRMTRSAGSEKSTSMPSPSRLKSSRTFNRRNCLPSSRRSAMKSIDQTRFGFSGTARASGFSRFNRLRGLILRLSSSSR
ncbi:hypothetical protein D3C72_1955530 [compost metagenome]